MQQRCRTIEQIQIRCRQTAVQQVGVDLTEATGDGDVNVENFSQR